MSLRARPVTNRSSDDDEEDHNDAPETPKPAPPPTLSQWAISQTLASTAQLANLLPTGTLLVLQNVTPIFTNHGQCDTVTRPLTAILLIFLTAACFLACFTDSFKSSDGQVFYGFATFKGMWVFDSQTAAASSSSLPDLRKYKLTAVDWIHAFVSAFVLWTLAMRDRSVVSCFYPKPSHEAQEVLDIVPLGLGLVLWFVVWCL
ncbi:protein DMP5-like [Rutidosis leptorrhynchoides]|uniref:protein DMP5-like n=1 Tax=Rutidosis leptorrhynchoides TaxID=125765 RepID=UPI003A9A561F